MRPRHLPHIHRNHPRLRGNQGREQASSNRTHSQHASHSTHQINRFIKRQQHSITPSPKDCHPARSESKHPQLSVPFLLSSFAKRRICFFFFCCHSSRSEGPAFAFATACRSTPIKKAL